MHAHTGGEREVVGHEHQLRHPRVAGGTQGSEQLGLGDVVERRGRFIGEQHRRATCERERQRDTLRLAAAQLVRIAAQELVREPDLCEELTWRVVLIAMKVQQLAQLRLDAANRIEAGRRVLGQQAQATSTQSRDGPQVRE